jgi:hypothetical protein
LFDHAVGTARRVVSQCQPVVVSTSACRSPAVQPIEGSQPEGGALQQVVSDRPKRGAHAGQSATGGGEHVLSTHPLSIPTASAGPVRAVILAADPTGEAWRRVTTETLPDKAAAAATADQPPGRIRIAISVSKVTQISPRPNSTGMLAK